MVGFNRRFAPLLTDLRDRFGTPGGNSSLRYLVNAGRLDPSSWYLDAGKEGSRFAGEGGHFIDTLSWWLNSPPTEVYAVPGPDAGDVVVTLRFANGSVGTISYVGGGNARFPKETLDITGGGRNAPAGQLPERLGVDRPQAGHPQGPQHRQGPADRARTLRRRGRSPAARCRSRSTR